MLGYNPALATTFINNPTLGAALSRLAQRGVCARVDSAAEAIISGIETPDGTSDDHDPTEQELNEAWLIDTGWERDPYFAGQHGAMWLDPLTGDRYFIEGALKVQAAREELENNPDSAGAFADVNGGN